MDKIMHGSLDAVSTKLSKARREVATRLWVWSEMRRLQAMLQFATDLIAMELSEDHGRDPDDVRRLEVIHELLEELVEAVHAHRSTTLLGHRFEADRPTMVDVNGGPSEKAIHDHDPDTLVSGALTAVRAAELMSILPIRSGSFSDEDRAATRSVRNMTSTIAANLSKILARTNDGETPVWSTLDMLFLHPGVPATDRR